MNLPKDINSLSNTEVITMLYDLGIESCEKHDRKRLRKVMIELLSSITFEGGELAHRMYALYEYCLAQSRAGNLSEIKNILTELKEAWVESFKQSPSRAA